jgi:hypothetical protein
VNPAWEYLAWRSLPVVLVLAWFVLLIGGFGLGGLLHLLLLAGIAVFGFQLLADRST